MSEVPDSFTELFSEVPMSLEQIEEACEENVRLGLMEHAEVVDGEQRYRMTPEGEAKVAAILSNLKGSSN